MAKESMKDLEKQVTEDDSKDALPPVQVMAGSKEQDPLISDDLHVVPAAIDGGVTAANMNPTGKKSLRCWIVVAGSVMFLTNYIQEAPKYQLIPMEVMVIFTMFMCAIFLVFRTMKQM